MSEYSYLNESLKKVVKGAGLGFVGTIIGRGFGYLTRIVLARYLSTASYGLLNLGLAVFGIVATIAGLGLGSGVTRYVAYYKGEGNEWRIKGTISSSLKIGLPPALLLGLLLYMSSDWIAVHAFHNDALSPVLRITSLAVPFSVLATIFISAIVGFQDLKYKVAVSDISENAMRFVMVSALLFLGFDLLGATWGWCIPTVASSLLAFHFLQRKVFPVIGTKTGSEPMGRELLSFSLPLLLVGVSGLVLEWTDTLMLGYFTTPSDVGVYNATLPTARLIQTLPAIFAVIFMPVISELFSRQRYSEIEDAYSVVTRWIISLAMPAFLLMSLFSSLVLEVIFGAEYTSGAQSLIILSLGYLLASLFGLATSILEAYGRTRIIMGCMFATATMNILLNWSLIPTYGIAGAAIATSISSIFLGSVQFLFAYRISKMHPFRVGYLKPVLASILSVLIVYVITKYLIGASLPVLVAMFFVFLATYFFLLLLMKGFEEEDLMIMRAIDERLGTKTDLFRRVIKRFL